MTIKEKIEAILACNFSGFKDEYIETATNRIMEVIYNAPEGKPITLGEDYEISFGFQDFGRTYRDGMTWELYRITDFKPFIRIKPKEGGAFVNKIDLKMTNEQAIKIKQSINRVWNEDALAWHDKQSGGNKL